jgi:hypothetical protein
MDQYTARIAPSAQVAEGASYEALLDAICEYTVRAAFAHANDQHGWEQDELRRKGLSAIELFHNGKAVWLDAASFGECLSDETSHGTVVQFERTNEMNLELSERIERDLVERWRLAGYTVVNLRCDMKKLFEELEADAHDCDRQAREAFIVDILRTGANARRSNQR